MTPATDPQATAGAMPQDPTATAGAMPQDPTATAGAMPQDPTATDGMDATSDTSMMDDDNTDTEDGGDDTDEQELLDTWNQLSIEDKAAAKKYMSSMIDDNEEVNNAEDEAGMNDEEGADMDATGADATGGTDATAQAPQQPMAESFTFSKKQLKKLNEMRRLMK